MVVRRMYKNWYRDDIGEQAQTMNTMACTMKVI